MKYNMIFNMLLLGAASLSLGACSNDEPVITNKDFDNTTTFLASPDEAKQDIYFKPTVGTVGDPMPFYDPVAQDFKILYLQEYPNNDIFCHHPIWGLSTKDGSSYTSLGELIPTGSSSEMDMAPGTGSTIYHDGVYYTFYTGHSYRPAITGGLNEAVMLATSSDFRNWEKDRNLLLTGSGEYSDVDFRDPIVFKGDDNKFHMLVSTKQNGKGVLAEYTSTDLHNWNSEGVFMTMMWDRFYECPDIFKMGDWWYLIYSEMHNALRKVQYFKGRTLDDLKACTKDDAGIWPDDHEGFLDSRGLYAAKTASNGTDRYVWGWCANRPGNINTNAYGWAGNLVMHKLIQHADGTLSLGEVPGIASKFGNGTAYADFALNGEAYKLMPRLGVENRISFTVTTSNPWDKFGVSFGRGDDSDTYYSLIVNPESETRRKINFEEEGGRGFIPDNDGYNFAAPADGVYNVTITIDNSVVTMYINDNVAQTTRIYNSARNSWSINSYGGDIRISNLTVSKK
ncbi:MAG: DUF4975 domain-containing protein [Muribaculaceae bacterium]|nr:DUF4975 domain-containing protein [Muribaculaceae bacterium]